MQLSVVILAAGKSTRFKSKTPKVLHPLLGRPMIQYNLDTAIQLSKNRPVIVVGPETGQEIRTWGGERAKYVLQKDRLGTGHAVMQTESLLKGAADHVLVLYGDMPLLQEATLHRLVEHHLKHQASLSLLTVERDNPYGFGRIVRDSSGRVQAIVEEAEATAEIAAIRELNAGIFIIKGDFLWPSLKQIRPSPKKGEYYLTDLVEIAVADNQIIETVTVDSQDEVLGINTRVEMSLAIAALRHRINESWMLKGVSIMDPATTTIEADVILAQDTVIYPNTYLKGTTSIGEDCEIGPNTLIESCTIGNRCKVLASVLEHAVMEDDSEIGPFGHLRKGAHLCEGVHMGNFGEVKNSRLGPGVKMGHFSYVGDAEVGANVNISAGIITCNYDGKHKHRTEIEDNTFIGSGTMLVAPLHIGPGAKIGAGAVVTRDIPPETLAYGVPARVKRNLTEDEKITQENKKKNLK